MKGKPLSPQRIHLVQLAGGRGLRAGGGPGVTPKQFRETGRGPLLAVSLRAFLSGQSEFAYRVGSVTVVVPAAWRSLAADLMATLLPEGEAIPWALAAAGSSRTASTWNALSLLASGKGCLPCPDGSDLVAIHDAARPFASASLLARLILAVGPAGGVVPGIPVHDTVVQGGGETSAAPIRYLPRDDIMAVQTPQVFRWEPCLAAHQWAAQQKVEFTDDGGLLAACGHPPAVVTGDPGNWKVTAEVDWQRVLAFFKN